MEKILSLQCLIVDEDGNIKKSFYQHSENHILEITIKDILFLISQYQVFHENSNTKFSL